MRVLVVGLNGQLARSLVARAEASGAAVATLGRPDLDLTNLSSIAPAIMRHRADIIVNAAAYTAVDQAENDPKTAFSVNAEAPRQIARAASKMGVPLIHLSTDYVFDGSADGWRRETDAVAPRGVYGRSKLAGEDAVRAETARHVIMRTAWVFSPWGRNFVRTMLQLATERDEVRVVADQIGSPTYALDLADGVFAVCHNLARAADIGPAYGVFHVTGGGSASWAELATASFAASALRGGPTAKVLAIPSSAYPTAAKRPANSRLDNTLIRETHGVALPDWRNALDRCIAALI